MTEKQLGRIVWAWQKRLGLATWDLEMDLKEPCSDDADAVTWRSNQYERARMSFASDWKTWTKNFANVIVVHELIHLLTRDVEEVMKLSIDSSTASVQIEKQQNREIEVLVDRLAYRLVELGGPV